jgi:hypothetical protein
MVRRSNYKYGDKREDGYVWVGIRYARKKSDGTYPDDWRSPEAFKAKIESNRANKKLVYDLISQEVNNYKIKKGCAHCNYNKEAVALDFHHANRDDKIINVSSHWKTSWKQYEKMKMEMKKCIVLCANCHRIEEKRIRDGK